jgi:hypothetical protein
MLWHTLNNVHLTSEPDRSIWRWSSSGSYTAASVYRIMHEGTTRLPGARWVWKNWAPQRVQFFTWLVPKQRLWTADRRRRHNLDAHDTCWLCDQEFETADHLLANCSSAKQIWWNTLSWMDCSCSFVEPTQLHLWWNHLRMLRVKERRRGFDTLFMLIIWAPLIRGANLHRAGASRPDQAGQQAVDRCRSKSPRLFEARVVRIRVGPPAHLVLEFQLHLVVFLFFFLIQ